MNIVTKNHFKPKANSFDNFLVNDLFNWSGWLNESGTMPNVNVSETDEQFVVEMAAPGLKKEHFKVELENDTLKISASIEENVEDQKVNYTRKEFTYRSFSRSFHLPNTIEPEKIGATYQDGILRLEIPKKEEAKKKAPKTIHIS